MQLLSPFPLFEIFIFTGPCDNEYQANDWSSIRWDHYYHIWRTSRDRTSYYGFHWWKTVLGDQVSVLVNLCSFGSSIFVFISSGQITRYLRCLATKKQTQLFLIQPLYSPPLRYPSVRVLASSAGGSGFNPQSRTLSY